MINAARLLLACIFLSAVISPASPNFNSAAFGHPTQDSINDNVTLQTGIVVSTGVTPLSTTTGKTLMAQPNLTLKTLVLIGVGNSIIANSLPTSHTPTNTVLQLNVYDSNVYQAKDPLMGTSAVSGGNYMTYLADKLITDGKFAQVILVPIAIGGSTSLDWSTSGVVHQRARVACLEVSSLWPQTANFSFGMIYENGTNDAGIAGTTSQQWQDRYNSWHSAMVSYGCNFDTFVPISTRYENATSATIQGAQAAVVSGNTYAGPNTDTLTATGSNLQADNTHLSDAGGSNNANLWATLLEAHY